MREAIVREAHARLLEVAQHGLVGEAAARRLLDAWRDRLVAVQFAAAAPDADVSQAWRELGGVALALSAIADQMLSDRDDVGVELGDVMLAPVLGLVGGEGDRLEQVRRDPPGALGRYLAEAQDLLARVGTSQTQTQTQTQPRAWLWLDLELAGARAAAAAALVSLNGAA